MEWAFETQKKNNKSKQQNKFGSHGSQKCD